jgi:hypothetical protein
MDMSEFTQGPLTLDEMMKIVSLLENPAEAAAIRKALRFYEIPIGLEYKWGKNEDTMKAMDHFAHPQNDWEMAEMLKIIAENDCKALLEVGSSFGGTLKRMASVMPQGSQIVAVDLPLDSTPKYLNPVDSLKETCRQLGKLGAKVELFLGDSHSAKIVEAVSGYGPYDFIFIDGDHSYEGMKADWENYGPMGRIVAFHDIGGNLPGCMQAWQEIKATGVHTQEFIAQDQVHRFGIGIVYRE